MGWGRYIHNHTIYAINNHTIYAITPFILFFILLSLLYHFLSLFRKSFLSPSFPLLPAHPPSVLPFLPSSSATCLFVIDVYMDMNMLIISESSDAPVRTPVNHKLEPLLEILSKYFNTMIDLRTRILGYYKVFDADQDGEVTFTVMEGRIC